MIVQQSLEELGMEMVEMRMEDATNMPAEPSYRLSNLVQVPTPISCGLGSCHSPGMHSFTAYRLQHLSRKCSTTKPHGLPCICTFLGTD